MHRVRSDNLDLRAYVQAGDAIVISQGTAEPQSLTARLLEQAGDIPSLDVFLGGGSFSKVFTPTRHGGHRLRGYGAVGDHRALIKCGAMQLLPAHVSSLPLLIGDQIGCDVAMIQVAGPRPDGSYSYSLASDYTVEAVQRARVVIAELNQRAPETCCETSLAADDIDLLVECDRPMLEVARAPVSDLDRAIARNISAYIGDRTTLQIGNGAVPEAIIASLGDRRDLGIHTGVIGDAIIDLIERGIITNAYKEVLPGVSVTGTLWGTSSLYRFVHQNPAILLSRIRTTHAPEVLSKLSRLVSINSAIEVDLTGQVNAEQIGGEYIGAIGGQVDFVRAASRAPNGASIIALASTARGGTVSKIVSRLDGPVTTARSDVDVIATEHGTARLKGLSLRERVKTMIAIADERFREGLEREAAATWGVQ